MIHIRLRSGTAITCVTGQVTGIHAVNIQIYRAGATAVEAGKDRAANHLLPIPDGGTGYLP